MLRDDVEADLRERMQDGPRLYPAYEDYCFGNVPGTLTSALGEPTGTRRLPADVYDGVDGVGVDGDRDVDYVVVFLVDGFGLSQWHDHREHPVVSGVEESTTVTPLTSVFPSETAAAITTFNTGVYPAEHGVLGWNVYDPELDASFRGLGFDGKAGSSVEEFESADAYAVDPLYPALAEAGVESRLVAPFPCQYAGATGYEYDGADVSSVVDATEEAVQEANDPSYVYVYLPHVDHEGHASGTQSAPYASVVDETWRAVGDAVAATRAAVDADDDVLVAFVADHGHVDTDPERNVDLGEYPTVVDGLERYGDGSPVYLSGSPRNVELHVRADARGDVRRVLEDEVGAYVLDGESVLERELFGDGPVASETERRVGDLVALHPTLGTWFGGDVESEELRLDGMHGGLHPDEMLVPFAAGRLEDVADAL
ncbi:alkaline phosphatase family protein [Halorubellus sp. PRR65]|uniref:alkaline phosphatase family protein n=1 Tax=Halorubellus sp. PRR65 TaxID=3098148 RepID=UPI002B256AD2|nr:alkaline phosphatase family protein [Halorubellus sp. PRR65]